MTNIVCISVSGSATNHAPATSASVNDRSTSATLPAATAARSAAEISGATTVTFAPASTSASAFAVPTGPRFGTMGRNAISGPGTYGLNAKIGRTLRLREGVSMEIRAESLNVTNTPQFSNPDTTLGNANFGYVTGTRSSGTGVNGTGGGRVIQFAAKVTF